MPVDVIPCTQKEKAPEIYGLGCETMKTYLFDHKTTQTMSDENKRAVFPLITGEHGLVSSWVPV